MLVQIFLLSVAFSQALGNTSDKQKLVGDLMKNYMRAVEPNDTPLKMGVSLMCANLDSHTHKLTTKLLEKYMWQDNRLTWTPAEHGGLITLRLPAKMIWTPDVRLYTGQDEVEVRDDVNVVVLSNGTVIWIPMVVYKTYCSSPSADSTTCKMQIGSWTYDANMLNLQLDGEGFDTHMYLDTCPYTVHDAKVKVESQIYPCCPEPYASMHIEFKVTPRQ